MVIDRFYLRVGKDKGVWRLAFGVRGLWFLVYNLWFWKSIFKREQGKGEALSNFVFPCVVVSPRFKKAE
jgi:hypothetical protein